MEQTDGCSAINGIQKQGSGNLLTAFDARICL
jgi:hypothetical protein